MSDPGLLPFDEVRRRLRTVSRTYLDVDVCQLVHTELQRVFLEESGLGRARPDAVIEFSLLDGYPQLLEAVKAHGYDIMRRGGSVPTPDEVAGDWYDTVCVPALEAVRRTSPPETYASWGSTDADLLMWIYQRRRDLRAADASVDFAGAARDAERIRFTRRQRRDLLRNGRRPQPRRGADA